MKNIIIYVFSIVFIVGATLSCNQNQEDPLKVNDTKSSYDYVDKVPISNEPISNEFKKTKFGLWEQLAPPPQKFEGGYVSAIDGKIIAAGGYPYTNRLQIYDIETATWSSGTSMPSGHHNCEGSGVAQGGLLYVVGGRDMGHAFWAYDYLLDTWDVTLPQLPTARGGLAAVSVGNDIYAIGGRLGGSPRNGTPMDVVECYNVSSGVWVTVAPLPSPRMDLAAAVIGGKIYVFGGFDSNKVAMNDVDVYDPKTDTWDTAPADMPTARAGLYAVGVKGGTVYVIGGQAGGVFNTAPGSIGTIVEAYKVSNDEWTTSDNFNYMPTARGEAGVASHGGAIYMVGGGQPAYGSYNRVQYMEVFFPSKK